LTLDIISVRLSHGEESGMTINETRPAVVITGARSGLGRDIALRLDPGLDEVH
jgi:hypothetical protein